MGAIKKKFGPKEQLEAIFRIDPRWAFTESSPFMEACKNGADLIMDKFMALLNDGRELADIDWFCDGNGTTPFHCGLPYKTMLKLFEGLPFAKEMMQRRDWVGWSVLHRATVNNGDVEFLSFAISTNLIDVDSTDQYGETSLHKAILFRRIATAKILLRAGCRSDGFDVHGRSPLKMILRFYPYHDEKSYVTNLWSCCWRSVWICKKSQFCTKITKCPRDFETKTKRVEKASKVQSSVWTGRRKMKRGVFGEASIVWTWKCWKICASCVDPTF